MLKMLFLMSISAIVICPHVLFTVMWMTPTKLWHYVTASASRDSGISPSLLGALGTNAGISESVDISTSRGTGHTVGILFLVVISTPRNDVPRDMIRTILTTELGTFDGVHHG
jgi:hypothetical protein